MFICFSSYSFLWHSCQSWFRRFQLHVFYVKPLIKKKKTTGDILLCFFWRSSKGMISARKMLSAPETLWCVCPSAFRIYRTDKNLKNVTMACAKIRLFFYFFSFLIWGSHKEQSSVSSMHIAFQEYSSETWPARDTDRIRHSKNPILTKSCIV